MHARFAGGGLTPAYLPRENVEDDVQNPRLACVLSCGLERRDEVICCGRAGGSTYTSSLSRSSLFHPSCETAERMDYTRTRPVHSPASALDSAAASLDASSGVSM